jgi:hypothetical protein
MPKPPTTYEEITRRTVPQPDTSWRPSLEQEREAFAGHREMDADENALYERILEVFRNSGLDTEQVMVEVRRDRVSLRGNVASETDLTVIPELVRDIEGVGSVDDRLVVLPTGAAD